MDSAVARATLRVGLAGALVVGGSLVSMSPAQAASKGAISGRATDGKGHALAGHAVRLYTKTRYGVGDYGKDGGFDLVAEHATGRKGYFHFRGLAPRKYRLQVFGDAGVTARMPDGKFRTEFYDNVKTVDNAKPIPVRAGRTTCVPTVVLKRN